MRERLKRALVLTTVAVSLFAFSGCATYWRDRGHDFSDMFDIGVTYSKDWQWAFYNSFESIIALGYADYQATYYGWGGGHFGKNHLYLNAWGALVWADEQIGWDGYDVNDPNTLYCQTVGLVGHAQRADYGPLRPRLRAHLNALPPPGPCRPGNQPAVGRDGGLPAGLHDARLRARRRPQVGALGLDAGAA